jgi:acyl-CoA dehydrogenase family member 9
MVDKDISFMRSLCLGQIEEDLLFPFPDIDDGEKEMLHTVVDSLKSLLAPRSEDFRRWDREGEIPSEFIEELKAFGMFSFVIPEEYGGMGFGSAAYSRALQEVARYDASVAVTIGAHSSIGMRGLLLFGNEEQKKRFYPVLATGEMIAAFCLTEPNAGSDAAALRTSAKRDGDDWILNGNKLWITNGGIADFFTVFAKCSGEDGQGKMTAFIVTKDMEGVSIGPHEDKMGIRGSSTTTVAFDDVRVPSANILGEVGKGFKVAMKILNSGRTGLGGGSIGAMKELIRRSTTQAKERVQFDKPIAEFGLIKQKIGHMVVECYAAESAVSLVAGLVDSGHQDYAVEAAISKVYTSEALWRCADEALQVAGGNGYMCEFPYERILRDCRINRIFEGTNDILRLFIALTAMNDVGSQLKELSASMKGIFDHPIKGFGVLSDYARHRASLATGLRRSEGKFSKLPEALSGPGSVFEASIRDLAVMVDRLLRKHGKKIIDRQFATRRLADIMIDLFVLAATLSRVSRAIEEKGAEKAKEEIDIVKVLAGQVEMRSKRNFHKIDDNDDELIKSLADHALEAEDFGWDSI